MKHLQEIHGVSKKAYWIANAIIDWLKVMTFVITLVICFHAVDTKMENASYIIMLMPFNLVPFTYVSSFIFTTDSAGQTATMFFHFFVLAIFANIAQFLMIVPNYEIYGDILHYMGRLLP